VKATVYVADWCAPCHEAVAYLRSRGVAVTEIDVDEHPEQAAALGVTDVPLTVFASGARVSGFDKGKLDAQIGSRSGAWMGAALAGLGVIVAAYILVR
jgi:glutaredoxin